MLLINMHKNNLAAKKFNCQIKNAIKLITF